MKRFGLFLITLLLLLGATIASAQTSTATPTRTPTPMPTGTLMGFPVLPTARPTLAATVTPVWATPTFPTYGERYIPPTPPGELYIPEVGQRPGFGAIGQSNVWRFVFYITYTGVSFWNWVVINAGDLIDAVRNGLAIGFVVLQVIGKLNKYQGRTGTTWAARFGGQIMRQINRNRPITPKSGNPFEDPTKTKSKSVLLLPLVALTIASPHQQVCSAVNSCEGIPWQLPQLPALLTPTPFPTGQITALYSPTPTGTLLAPTTTPPAPTATPGIDMTLIGAQLGTLQAIAAVTPISVTGELAPQNVSGNVGRVYGLFLGFKDVHFGAFTPLLQAAFFFMFTYMASHFFFLLLPVLSALIGLIRRAIQFLLDFLPF